MKHISPDKMNPRVRALWDAAQEAGKSPEETASIVGVSHMTIYRWYKGSQPLPAHEHLITNALHEITRKSVVWTGGGGPSPDKKVLNRKLDSIYAKVMEKADPEMREVLADNYAGFCEWAHALKRYRVRVRF